MSRFLAPWRQFFAAATDASPEYAEMAGLMVLSTLSLQRKSIRVGRGTRMNLYAMLVGESSVARKSTSVNYAKQMVARVDGNRVGPKDYTIEGLISWMRQPAPGQKGGRNKLCIFADEFGADLARYASYAKTATADLCALYDGESYEKVRAKGATLTVDKPRVSLFGAAAYDMMEANLTSRDWRNGFLMRFIYAAPLQIRPTALIQPPHPQGLWDAAENAAKILKDDLTKSNSGTSLSGGPTMSLSPQASSMFAQWSQDMAQKVAGHDIATIYIGRFTINVMKLAGLYQIDEDPMLPIGPLAMNTAIQFAMMVLWPGFLKALDRTTGDSLEGMSRIVQFRLGQAGPAGIRLADLYSEFGRHATYDVVLRLLKGNDVVRTWKSADGRDMVALK